jgi:hypothetical protein
MPAAGAEHYVVAQLMFRDSDAFKCERGRDVRTEATLRANRLVDERYFTRTVRPTVEHARDIACLVNQLLNPPVPPAKQEPATAAEPRADPAEIVVIAPPRPCSVEYTDGHWESLVVRVGGAPATASRALSCGDAGRLEALLSSAVGAPFLDTGLATHAR